MAAEIYLQAKTKETTADNDMSTSFSIGGELAGIPWISLDNSYQVISMGSEDEDICGKGTLSDTSVITSVDYGRSACFQIYLGVISTLISQYIDIWYSDSFVSSTLAYFFLPFFEITFA